MISTRDVDIQHEKYREEKYAMSVNFTKRLIDGETIQTVEVTAIDSKGQDATDAIIVSNSPAIDQTATRVSFKWNDGGVVGHYYYVSVKVGTQNDSLEYKIELKVN